MRRYASYSFIKNATFVLLIAGIISTSFYALYFSGRVYSFAVDDMRVEYNNLVLLQSIENSMNRAFEVYNSNINRDIVREDDILLPIKSMLTISDHVRSQSENSETKQLMKQVSYGLKIIRAGYSAVEEVRYTPSQSDYSTNTINAINLKRKELYQLLKTAVKSVEPELLEEIGRVMTILSTLGDIMEQYFNEDQLDNETVRFLLLDIINKAEKVNVAEQNRAMFDVIDKNLHLLIIGSEEVVKYKMIDPNMGHLQEEELKVMSLWNSTISNLIYIRSVEAEKLRAKEIHIEHEWAIKKQVYVAYAVVSSLAAILLALFLNRAMYRRIYNILSGIKRFSSGDYDARIRVLHDDYISTISHAFNEMADSLKQKDTDIREVMGKLLSHKESLQEAHDSMEEQVAQRTQKLTELTEQLKDEITYRKDKEKELQLFKKIAQFSNDSIFVTDMDENFVYTNDSFTRLNGYAQGELIGLTPEIFKTEEHTDFFYSELRRNIQEQRVWLGEIITKRKNGSVYPAYVSIYTLKGDDGEVEFVVTIQRDISDIKNAQEELKQLAFYDSLTGLPNRALCIDRLTLAISSARRHGGKVGVMFLDLDKFKNINDTLGHDAGDILLEKVSGRLKICARETDTVCRLGGDEFVIILTEIVSRSSLEMISERIIEAVSNPFDIMGNVINTSTSIGITVFPDDGDSQEKLMKNADMAMYKAKSTKRGTYEFYSDEYEQFISQKVNVENRLMKAVAEREFVPFYQPVVDTSLGKVVGVEVLARWLDGDVVKYPNEFIDILEESGEIYQMTKMIIEDAMIFLKKMQIYGMDKIWLSINISPVTMIDIGKIRSMIGLIKKFDVDTSWITFEITENILIQDFEAVQPVLEEIRNNKIGIALDDFGSGYSSLNYLGILMPDKLKLDKSFVSQIDKGEGEQICRSVAKLAENMGISLIAEGVETEKQLKALEGMGYSVFQGYYFAKPVWEDVATEYMLQFDKT